MWQEVLSHGVGIGHEGEKLDSMKHEHIQMFPEYCLDTDCLDVIQLPQVAYQQQWLAHGAGTS